MAVIAVTASRSRAGDIVYDRPPVAQQRVDQAALSDVHRSAKHHAPRLHEPPTKRGTGEQCVDLLPGSVVIPAGRNLLDIAERTAKGPVILIQEDGGRAFGARLGQRDPSCGGKRITTKIARRVAPRHALKAGGDEQFLNPRHGRMSAVAVNLNRAVGATANDHFLARFVARVANMADYKPVDGKSGERPPVARAKHDSTASTAVGPSTRNVAIAPRPAA